AGFGDGQKTDQASLTADGHQSSLLPPTPWPGHHTRITGRWMASSAAPSPSASSDQCSVSDPSNWRVRGSGSPAKKLSSAAPNTGSAGSAQANRAMQER